jgi:hypothetical protein
MLIIETAPGSQLIGCAGRRRGVLVVVVMDKKCLFRLVFLEDV